MMKLIIMTRYPVAGTAKSRLWPALGPAGAAAFQRSLTERLVSVLTHGSPACEQVEVRVAGGSVEKAKAWLLPFVAPSARPSVSFVDQGVGDLGDRLQKAFPPTADSPAIVVGCDCPDVSREIIGEAFARMAPASNPVECVIGPASDGGYYLLGLGSGRASAGLFSSAHVAWGTEAVLSQTLAQAAANGVSVHCLDTSLSDIDVPGDLHTWARCVSRADGNATELPTRPSPAVSVIIPTLNEARSIGRLLDCLYRQAKSPTSLEIIISDGGSADQTVELALAAHAKQSSSPSVCIVRSRKGRGIQMNAGAAVARAPVLLFLHADTVLVPKHFDSLLTRVHGESRDQKPSDLKICAFQLAFDGQSTPMMRFIERSANRRSLAPLFLPYGDQGYSLTRQYFWDLGGFDRTLPLMEDVDFVRRARKGVAVVPNWQKDTSSISNPLLEDLKDPFPTHTVPQDWLKGDIRLLAEEPLVSSSRRYQEKGPFITGFLNQSFMFLYFFLNIHPRTLYKLYYRRNP